MPKIIHKKFESDLFTFKKVIANRESAQNWHFAGGGGGGGSKNRSLGQNPKMMIFKKNVDM